MVGWSGRRERRRRGLEAMFRVRFLEILWEGFYDGVGCFVYIISDWSLLASYCSRTTTV